MQHKNITLTFHGATWINVELAFELIQTIGTIMNFSDPVIEIKTGEKKADSFDFSLINVEKAFHHSQAIHQAYETYDIPFFSEKGEISGSIVSSRIRKEYLNMESVLRHIQFNFLAIAVPLNQHKDDFINDLFKIIADRIDAVWGRAYIDLALYPKRKALYSINYGLPGIYWKNYFGALLNSEIDLGKLGDDFKIIKTEKGVVVNYTDKEESFVQQAIEFEKRIGQHYFCELKSCNDPVQEWIVSFLIKSAWKNLTEKKRKLLFNFNYSKMSF